MRKTLRRSCDACARSKLSCDLRTPQCSRCFKRKVVCAYANQPFSATDIPEFNIKISEGPNEVQQAIQKEMSRSPKSFFDGISHKFDPFDSYPQARLPRTHIQRLIRHFLSSIAFQYYPLDMNAASNPFVVSWWPCALADPALFHVSLQAASLDIDLREGKGFANSELLMADSVSLVRQKVDDPQLACQDETLDSIVTLAAIEFGKGNTLIGQMHIEGVKRIVDLRGGIRQIKVDNPLTARMVAWVSLILAEGPQFSTETATSSATGLPAISRWYTTDGSSSSTSPLTLFDLKIDPLILAILNRLRTIFNRDDSVSLSSTEFHDLTCFVLHKLLKRPKAAAMLASPASETLRICLALYMLAIHGPTYFSHAHLQQNLVSQLKVHAQFSFDTLLSVHQTLALWVYFVGMINSSPFLEYDWFVAQARRIVDHMGLMTWNAVQLEFREILWFPKAEAESLFERQWQALLALG